MTVNIELLLSKLYIPVDGSNQLRFFLYRITVIIFTCKTFCHLMNEKLYLSEVYFDTFLFSFV